MKNICRMCSGQSTQPKIDLVTHKMDQIVEAMILTLRQTTYMSSRMTYATRLVEQIKAPAV